MHLGCLRITTDIHPSIHTFKYDNGSRAIRHYYINRPSGIPLARHRDNFVISRILYGWQFVKLLRGICLSLWVNKLCHIVITNNMDG